MNGLRILKPRSIALIAILVSVLGHLYLFIGFPSFLFSKATPLEENIVAELRVEPVRKVQLSKPTVPAPSVRDDHSNAVGDGAKIGRVMGKRMVAKVVSRPGNHFVFPILAFITTMPTLMGNIFKAHQLNGRLMQRMVIVYILIFHMHFLGHLSLSPVARLMLTV